MLQFTIQVAHSDIDLIEMLNVDVIQDVKVGKNGVAYDVISTANEEAFDLWRRALSKAIRPYKYADAPGRSFVPANNPSW
jgi:hypothetical protein